MGNIKKTQYTLHTSVKEEGVLSKPFQKHLNLFIHFWQYDGGQHLIDFRGIIEKTIISLITSVDFQQFDESKFRILATNFLKFWYSTFYI